jgi:alpha-beta hydrolase superfamily lysophospholipase
MKSARIALLAIACTLSFTASAQWQWLDQAGRKVFSDQAPPPSVPANRVLRAPPGRMPAADAQETPVAGAAVAVPVLAAPAGKDPVLEEKRRKAEAAEAAKKKAEAEKFASVRAENCTRARTAKAGFESGQRIAQISASGEREFLSDEQRAAELRRLEGVIASDCHPAAQ